MNKELDKLTRNIISNVLSNDGYINSYKFIYSTLQNMSKINFHDDDGSIHKENICLCDFPNEKSWVGDAWECECGGIYIHR